MKIPEPLCFLAVYVWDELGEKVEIESYHTRACAESFTYRNCKEPELHLVIQVYAESKGKCGDMVLKFNKPYEVKYGTI